MRNNAFFTAVAVLLLASWMLANRRVPGDAAPVTKMPVIQTVVDHD